VSSPEVEYKLQYLERSIELEFRVSVFVEGGKLENPEKSLRSKAKTSNKLNPHMEPDRNRNRAALVGGERSNHCAIPAPLATPLRCKEA